MSYKRISTKQRYKEIFMIITETNVGGEQLGTLPSWKIDGAGEYVKMACRIPQHFTELEEIKLIVYPAATDADGMRFNMLYEYFNEGETAGAKAGSNVYAPATVASQMLWIDLKNKLWDSVAAADRLKTGDVLSIEIDYIAASGAQCATSAWIIGVWLKWR